VVLTSKEDVADSDHILEVLLAIDPTIQTLIAIGSGTITDIARFVSHKIGTSFVVLPTAPSVDGFTSLVSPLTLRGVKTTVKAHSPAAIFADLDVLSGAPRTMIAAGFGDMVGKHTAAADWRLASLLWDLPYDENIAERSLAAVRSCEAVVSSIGDASEAGVRTLFDGLVESGFCMLDSGNSLPASGAEHHYSHFWEMKLLREGKPAILHGAKVGVATIFVAGLYEEIKDISKSRVVQLLETSKLPSRDGEINRINKAYGSVAAQVLPSQTKFLDMSEEAFEQIKERIHRHWSAIQEIAHGVPSPRRIAESLRAVGGPVSMRDIGLSDLDRDLAAENAHYMRNHFTISRLRRILFPNGNSAASGATA